MPFMRRRRASEAGTDAHSGCQAHPTQPAMATCASCARACCTSCAVEVPGRVLCVDCAMTISGVRAKRR